jgi:hypothetical protein
MKDSFQVIDAFEDRGVSQDQKTTGAKSGGPPFRSLNPMNDLTSIQALKAFGYSHVEACFLRLVALHSGVFLPRQFNQYAGATKGKRVDNFLDQLRKNNHCRAYKLARNANIFHVTSKAVYRAIGHENLRHRRSHKIDYVKTKLLSLDYILENPAPRYLPTEEEKIHFFTKVLNVPMTELPAKAYKTPKSTTETLKYFIDKYPLFLPKESFSPAVVHFTYVDPGPYVSCVDFLNHLRFYARLFSHLPEARMVYIHQTAAKVKLAEDQFLSFFRSGCKVNLDDLEMFKYFRLREAWEAERYEEIGASELLFLNRAKKKFVGARYESLFATWKLGENVPATNSIAHPSETNVFTLTPYKIHESYSVFGDLD